MASNSIILKSKLNTKEWFDIVLHTINSTNQNLYQALEYRLDDNENWERFIFNNDNNIQRKCIYANKVELRNYVESLDNTEITEDIINNLDFSIEINDIDDMTAQELLGQIEVLNNELNSIKEMLSSYVSNTRLTLYASKDWVEGKNYLTQDSLAGYATETYIMAKIESINPIVDLDDYATKSYVVNKIEEISPSSIDLSSYATISYVMDKINSIEITGGTDIDLSSYATKSYVLEKIAELPSSSQVSLDGYATEAYVLEKINTIDVSEINIDLSDYATKSYVNEKVDDMDLKIYKFTYGAFAYITNPEISYQSIIIDDIESLFTVNDLYQYTFGNPYLESSSYTPVIWTYLGESPFPSNNENSSTLKENKDIKDLRYKINVRCDSANYNENSYLIQKATERIYFLQGDSITLDTYNTRNLNLTNYILTNCNSYNISNVDWAEMSSLNHISFLSNSNSIESRSLGITITDSNNTNHIFTITQPGNPNYDPNAGGGDQPGGDTPIESEVEYEITLSSLTDGVINENNITITCEKSNGSSAPVYHESSSKLRLYNANTMTISSTNQICKVEFIAETTYDGCLISNIPTLSSYTTPGQTWEGNSDEIIFTVSRIEGSTQTKAPQFRIETLKVTVLE